MKITGRLLARNTVLNLAGQAAPALIALVAVPVLIHRLGADRFGVLTLAWAVIGYFGLFDLGIGRALTQAASEAIGKDDAEQLARVSATALVALFALGCVGAIALAAGTHALVYRFLNIPAGLRVESLYAFYLMAVSLPFVLTSSGLRGLLEAHQHFGLVSALRVPFGIINFAGPLAVLPFSHSLAVIVAVLCVSRIASCVAHAIVCLATYGFLRRASPGSVADMLPLLRLGGWMTVTNVVSPLMSNMDRFIVGGILSVKAVTYYATPFDAVSKVTLLPASIMGVFFPAFAATHEHELSRTASLFDRSTRLIALATFPALLIVVTFAHTLLAVWIGQDYARASTSILQCLALGMYLTSFAYVPFALLQALGRPDVTAKLHLTELPLYALLIVALTHGFGLIGVAFAFTARVIFDMVVLYWLAGKALQDARAISGRVVARSAVMATVTGAIVCGGAFTSSTAAGIGYAGVALVTSAFVAWRWVLLADERALVTRAMPAFLRQQTGPA